MNPPPAPLTSYLPPTLQMWQLYLIAGVCVAVVGAMKKAPGGYNDPWIVQLVSMITGSVFAVLIVGSTGWVYATGTGLIAAWGATSFYDFFYGGARAFLSKFFGNAQSASSGEPGDALSVPRPSNPQNVSTDKKP